MTYCLAYNCPVLTCNKTFAVRSNARRHLKTHGIKLKTRDHGSKRGQIKLSEDEVGDNDTVDDAEMEISDLPSPSIPRISGVPVTTLAGHPDQDHHGHAKATTNVHEDHVSLATSVNIVEDGYSGTVVEQVKRGKANETKDKWEIEMSGKAKLRSVRKNVATGRTRRGLRSDDLVAKAKPTADDNKTGGRRRGTRNRP
jgi:hypothetical protein